MSVVPPALTRYLSDDAIGVMVPREIQISNFEGPPFLDLNPVTHPILTALGLPGPAVLLDRRQAEELRDLLNRWIASVPEDAKDQVGQAAWQRWASLVNE